MLHLYQMPCPLQKQLTGCRRISYQSHQVYYSFSLQQYGLIKRKDAWLEFIYLAVTQLQLLELILFFFFFFLYTFILFSKSIELYIVQLQSFILILQFLSYGLNYLFLIISQSPFESDVQKDSTMQGDLIFVLSIISIFCIIPLIVVKYLVLILS